ncbi:D-alanyl-D-alanine carboxypeptidase family protein [Bacillus sp. PS06]|uniref:D-alanyl-D-alanine carboxypeptidase family protein n=1 Tax=Bacillus sp. PS06 TaxID=2764176 RepID=UPI00177AB24D|nr:D-alanyl-D-alanine carboxypeptidase family protein [Bacillus sp. PS06]MBD8071453.1 D-alanyl-D-alanine carboxypeptidase [Bacillus sp. PS06]
MRRLKTILAVLITLFVMTSSPLTSYAISAKGAVLLEQHSGRVLYEKNAHTQMRIASITKIMTAILAIESGKLKDTVTISNKAAGTEGSSLYLVAGEKVMLEDLVYGLMLRSGNDSAVAIAEHVAGNLDSFVSMMNKKAKEIGMKNTVFANPHGLDDHENHYSTAYDMALLTRYAMKNDEYAKIAGTKSYTAKSLSKHGTVTWKNKNRLLTQLYPYCTGGKTGYTKRAKRTLVTTAEKDNLQLIAVTINDRNDWNDHKSLYNQAFNSYKLVNILEKNELPNLLDDVYTDNLFIKKDFKYPLKKDEIKNIALKVIPYNKKKSEKDQLEVGAIDIYMKDEQIGSVPLYSNKIKTSQPKKHWWDKFKKVF